MKNLALLVLVAFLGASCVKAMPAEPATTARTAGEYFALLPGARWAYEVELLGAKNAVEVRMVRQNGEGFYEDSTGAAFLVDSYGVRDQRRYLLRNPVQVGTKWTNVVSVSSIESYSILSAAAPCQTRAGSWVDCVVVESRNRVEEGKTLVNEFTLAVGVGIVRVATMLEFEGKRLPQSHLELVAFAKP